MTIKRLLSIRLPKLEIQLADGSKMTIFGNVIELPDGLSNEQIDLLIKSVEDNFWEYQVIETTKDDIKTKIADAYQKISPILSIVIMESEISINNKNTVVIHVPVKWSSMIGRLIGKNGRNTFAVQKELNMSIRITEDHPPENIELKNRLKELMMALMEEDK